MAAAEAEGKEAIGAIAASMGVTFDEYWAEYREYLKTVPDRLCFTNTSGYKRKWMTPLDEMPLGSITVGDLERLVVSPMLQAGKSPNTVEHVLAIFLAMWNRAKREGRIEGRNPKARVRRPKEDNRHPLPD